MAKIFSFNKSAPGLKPQPSRRALTFALTAKLQPDTHGENKEIQAIQLLATRGLIVYEKRFPSRFAFATWLRRIMDSAEADQLVDMVLNGTAATVPLSYDELDLVPAGFRALIED